MTGFAVLCSALATCPADFRHLLLEAFMQALSLGLAIVCTFLCAAVAMDIVTWFKNPDANADTLGKKVRLLLHTRCYWIAVSVTFPVAVILNLVPYYRTYGASGGDGVETMGWPLSFYEYGGIDGHWNRSVPIFCVDTMIAIVLAFVAGIGFRNGVRAVLIQSRRLLHKIRMWPNEDDAARRNPVD
jgi:hypothetical protein